MKRVFEHMKTRSLSFKERPLFLYLADESAGARQRLDFIPWMSHFVMTFADLYHFFLREEPAKDRYQELVNTHLSEEGTHWKWFLADLTALELDPTLRFTDALRFIWSDATIHTRRLAYEMCRLSAGMTSLEKLVMVMAIEATGRVGLESAVPVGCEAEKAVGRRLVYFGAHHIETERAHTVEESHVQQFLEATVVDETQLARLHSIVDQVFEHFTAFVDETFQCVRMVPKPAADFAQRTVQTAS